MENIKEALGGKSSNNQRATRPGVVQITHNNNGAAANAGEDCAPPLPPMPQLVAQGIAGAPEESEGAPSHDTSPQPKDPDRATAGGEESPGGDRHTSLRPQHEEVDAAADTLSELPSIIINVGGGEENSQSSQDAQQQVLPQQHQVGEEILFDAEVELIGTAGGDDYDHPAQTTQEQPVPSIQLTQGSFPIAQEVEASFEEDEEEDEGEGDQNSTEEEGEHALLDEATNIDYNHVILIRQEVALATTDGRGDEDEDSSSGEDDEKKCSLLPKRRSKRFVCGAVWMLAAVAFVLGGAAVAANGGFKNRTNGAITDEKDSLDDNVNDSSYVEVLLQDFLEKIGTNDHRIEGTPQYKAIRWLHASAREGSERFNLSEWAIRKLLVQRYVMAVFYYTTGGGRVADNSSGGWDDDCGFVTAKNECEWKCTKNGNGMGITCDESSRIQKILLPNNNLSGPIPREFKALTSLMELDISNNFIGGRLPESIGELRNMRSFNAADNELIGSLPSSLGNLSFLKSLNLMGNKFTGEIPPEVNRLGSLTSLWLSGNGFTGGMNYFCDSENRSLLRHQNRRFLMSTFYADCSSIACDCCTHCCISGMTASSCQPKSS